MSLMISGIRLPFDVPEEQAIAEAKAQCGITAEDCTAAIYRQSIDARHGRIDKIYSVCVDGIPNEAAFAETLHRDNVRVREMHLTVAPSGTQKLLHRPVIIGAGPAGIFAAYLLATRGYAPILLERGEAIEQRDISVDAFFKDGIFREQSNVQFGEGGAGTYSDGKLTTRIHDPRCERVLQTLVQHGAPEMILQQAKPHIGTDLLKKVVVAMRQEILAQGGTVQFNTQATDFCVRDGMLCGVVADGQTIACEQVILAIGHSARDTFQMLQKRGIAIAPKAFSVGARIEHLQEDVDRMLYGKYAGHPALPPAEYTLSHRTETRACYSFCMCPGGHVVAAQSEAESIVTNGMSYHARNGKNANAAIVVSVDPSDFATEDALGGIVFQRSIERLAWSQTKTYAAPCQLVGDFLNARPTKALGKVQPTYPQGVMPGQIDACLPPYVTEAMRKGLQVFGRKMRGFDDAEALLTAPETRTSSPIRILRHENLCSETIDGLYPCGEGAGYAGGIMSAAVDGVRVAEQIISRFAPIH